MRKHFSILLGMLAMLGGMTSCLKDNDDNNDEGKQILYDYCTIITDSLDNCTIYSDLGIEIHPTAESVDKQTDGKGFGDNRRAWMLFTFKSEDVINQDNGKTIINNAIYQSGEMVSCKEPISLSEANTLGVTNKDSIWDFTLGNLRFVNGFLNAFWDGYYSLDKKGKNIRPTLHLVYDENKINSDSIHFTIYYNRHDSINAKNSNKAWDQIDCFDLVNLVKSLPASDSIVLSVKTPTGKPQTAKLPRSKVAYPY